MKMMSMRKPRITRGAALLVAGVLAGVGMPGHSHADIGLCRTDPVLLLSDGRAIDLTTTIGDLTPNVQHISYIVHIPASESVTAVYSTPGPLGRHETVQVVADSSANTYTTDTVVTTASGSSPVTAVTTVVDPLSGNLASGSVSGSAGQDLILTLSLSA